MNPAHDVLSRAHQVPGQRRSQPALAPADYCARLPATYETDRTSLLGPPAGPPIRLPVTHAPRFTLGRWCLTPQAANAVPADEIWPAVARHAAGDWGALDEHDRQENERALGTRGRLVSVYQARHGQRFWVITDAGWEVTTVLLPEDY